jgi:hypothetical protein
MVLRSNDFGTGTCKASPAGPSEATLRLRAELSSYYRYGYSDKKSSHQAIALEGQRGESLTATWREAHGMESV